jgi:hypothetical protein
VIAVTTKCLACGEELRSPTDERWRLCGECRDDVVAEWDEVRDAEDAGA